MCPVPARQPRRAGPGTHRPAVRGASPPHQASSESRISRTPGREAQHGRARVRGNPRALSRCRRHPPSLMRVYTIGRNHRYNLSRLMAEHHRSHVGPSRSFAPASCARGISPHNNRLWCTTMTSASTPPRGSGSAHDHRRGITKKYGHFTAVDDVSFIARERRVTGFLRPTGPASRPQCGSRSASPEPRPEPSPSPGATTLRFPPTEKPHNEPLHDSGEPHKRRDAGSHRQ